MIWVNFVKSALTETGSWIYYHDAGKLVVMGDHDDDAIKGRKKERRKGEGGKKERKKKKKARFTAAVQYVHRYKVAVTYLPTSSCYTNKMGSSTVHVQLQYNAESSIPFCFTFYVSREKIKSIQI